MRDWHSWARCEGNRFKPTTAVPFDFVSHPKTPIRSLRWTRRQTDNVQPTIEYLRRRSVAMPNALVK